MNNHSQTGWFPWVALMTGSVGLALRCWLLSSMDSKGLLPSYHIAGILALFLLLLTMGLSFWKLRSASASNAYRMLFPPSLLAAAGTALGAAGLGFSAFNIETAGILGKIIPLLGIASIVALFYTAYCRLIGLRPNGLLHGIVVVYLLFRILALCRVWGSEPQLQLYLFPMLGSLFLLLASFFRTEADALAGDYRKYLFFGQAALFCCLMCLPGDDWVFYLSAAIWLATDYCVLPYQRYRG